MCGSYSECVGLQSVARGAMVEWLVTIFVFACIICGSESCLICLVGIVAGRVGWALIAEFRRSILLSVRFCLCWSRVGVWCVAVCGWWGEALVQRNRIIGEQQKTVLCDCLQYNLSNQSRV